MSEQREFHPRQFRGVWVRPEVFDMLRDHTITADESFLILVIDSLVNINGQDCYASNAYLGEQLNCPSRKIQRMLEHLVEIGAIIRRVEKQTKRYLRTAWSRWGASEGTHVTGDVPPRHRCRTPHVTGDVHIPSSRYHGLSLSVKGPKEVPKTARYVLKKVSTWMRQAQDLHAAISKVHAVPKNIKLAPWADAFRKLRQVDGHDAKLIAGVLNYYCGALVRGDKFLPIAESGRTFREKFARIEAAMRRNGHVLQISMRSSKPKQEHRGEKMTEAQYEAFMNDDLDWVNAT